MASRARKTWGVPNPIRSKFFRDSTDTPVTDIPQIINVGLVSPRKRQLELLREAAKMWASGVGFRIVFAGGIPDDPYGKAFANEITHAEQNGYASHVGFLNIDGLIQLMDQSHGMIHCPTEEAFGLVVAEGMARGLKFFGSDLGGIRDIADGMMEAELHADLISLMGGVRRWLDQGAPRAESSRAEIAKRYHPQVVATRHVEIYREVLCCRARGFVEK